MKNLLSALFGSAFVLCAIFGSPCVSAAETITYYYTNEQGTPLATTDAAGNIITAADYHPYGEQIIGPSAQGPGYTGHVNDAEVGLIYMQGRYYDAESSRFLSVDEIRPMASNAFSFNRYLYANANPVRYVDLDGKQSTEADAVKLASQLNEQSGKKDYVVVPVPGGFAVQGQQFASDTLALGTERAATEYSAKTPLQCTPTCAIIATAVTVLAGDQSKAGSSKDLAKLKDGLDKLEKATKVGQASPINEVRELSNGLGFLSKTSSKIPIAPLKAVLFVPAEYNNLKQCMSACTSDGAQRMRDDASK